MILRMTTNDSADDAKTVQQWVLFGDPSLKIGGYDVESGGSEFEVEVANVEGMGVSTFENVRSASNTPAQPATVPDTPLGPTLGAPGAEYTFTAVVLLRIGHVTYSTGVVMKPIATQLDRIHRIKLLKQSMYGVILVNMRLE